MRILSISLLGLTAVAIATAGQIQIGGGFNAGTGVSTTGLTSSYITVAGTQNGNLGPVGNQYSQKNFINNLFTGATITGSNTLGGTNLPNAASGNQQFTDPNNGIKFGMMVDGSSGGAVNEYWAGASLTSVGTSSIIVPVNQTGALSAYILMDDYYGIPNTDTDTVLFTFSDASTLSFNLIDGVNIGTADVCSANSTKYTTPGTPTCTAFPSGVTASTSDVAWSAAYSNSSTSNALPWSSTTGTLKLYDIAFDLSSKGGLGLNSITVTDNNALAFNSRLALAAVTLSTTQLVTTPEPSTILLVGLGVLGIGFVRRKKA